MKSISFPLFLIVSFLVHFVIVFVASNHHEHERAANPKPLPPPVQIEILSDTDQRETNRTLKRPTRKDPARKTSLRSKSPLVQDLMGSTKVRFGNTSMEGNPSGPHDPTRDSWGAQSGSIDSWENILFYKTIYEEIENSVFYPAVLAKQKIEGTFQARLTFDAVEGCLWKKATISEGNPNLRLFVLDLLRRTCESETVRRLRPLRTVTADMSFLFAIGEPSTKRHSEDERRKHGPRIVGNVLMFEAHSAQSALAWNLGPLTGVFPIPYVAVDFLWLQENWDKIVRGKIKTLPVR